jgi:hypothetical protein
MKTVIVLLDDRKLLEKIENQIFENTHEMIDQLKSWGMSEEEEDSLGYYEISEFMDLVNDQILDNLQDTFFGYVRINK